MGFYCVTGGSGFLGSRLATSLAGAGHSVLVPSRNPAGTRHLRVLPSVRVMAADMNDPDQAARALNGVDALVNLIGILNEPGHDGSGFRRAHVGIVRNLLDACGRTGVRRLIHVSALNAGAPDATSHYLATKGEAEDLIRGSPLEWTIFRPSVLFGPGDGFLHRFAVLARRIPLLLPLAMPDARFAPVHVDDVVAAIQVALSEPATAGRTYPLCGPDIVALREAVALVIGLMGLRRRVVGLSRRLSRLQATVMEYVPGKPFSLDNFRSLQLDSVCAENGFAELGLRPRSFLEHAPLALRATGLIA